jgi:hypothetical protein
MLFVNLDPNQNFSQPSIFSRSELLRGACASNWAGFAVLRIRYFITIRKYYYLITRYGPSVPNDASKLLGIYKFASHIK